MRELTRFRRLARAGYSGSGDVELLLDAIDLAYEAAEEIELALLIGGGGNDLYNWAKEQAKTLINTLAHTEGLDVDLLQSAIDRYGFEQVEADVQKIRSNIDLPDDGPGDLGEHLF